jgi:hypothetical protein
MRSSSATSPAAPAPALPGSEESLAERYRAEFGRLPSEMLRR